MGSRKQGDETNRLVLGVIQAHGQISTTEISKTLGRADASIREACRRLEAKGYLVKTCVISADGRKSVWSLANGPVDETRKHRVRTAPPEIDNWEPQPWVHPYRQRFLSTQENA